MSARNFQTSKHRGQRDGNDRDRMKWAGGERRGSATSVSELPRMDAGVVKASTCPARRPSAARARVDPRELILHFGLREQALRVGHLTMLVVLPGSGPWPALRPRAAASCTGVFAATARAA
jgi:hypothetical protein